MVTHLDIDRVVREVMRRLSPPAEQAPSAAHATITTDADRLCLEARLITLSQLDGKLNGAKTIVVAEKAVVTPAVFDLLREKGITLVRQEIGKAATALIGSLFIASSDKTLDAMPLAEFGQRLGYPAESLNAEHLQTAVDRLAASLSSPTSLGILITRQAAAATCLANRNRLLRAAWGVDVKSVKAAITTIAANVLVIDSSRDSVAEARGMMQVFLSTPREYCPYLKSLL